MAFNNMPQKAEDWLDDLETVGDYAAEKIGSVTKDMPIVKSLGAIATNPTPQEVGAQIYNLGSAISESAGEATKDPIDMALNYGPGAIGAMTAFHGTPSKLTKDFKFNIPSQSKNLSEIWGEEKFMPVTRHGAFLSTSKKFSKEFGNEVGKFDIKTEKIKPINEETIREFAESLDAFGPERDMFLGVKNLANDISLKKDVSLWKLFDDEVGEKFTAWLKSKGYDAAIFPEKIVGKSGKNIKGRTVVVLDPNKVKLVKAEDFLDQ